MAASSASSAFRPAPSRSSVVSVLPTGAGAAKVLLEDVLHKKSPMALKGWQKRTFRLYPTSILYSEVGEWAPKGKQAIALNKVSAVQDVHDGAEFEVVERCGTKGDHVYKLRASSNEKAKEWVEAVHKAQVDMELGHAAERRGCDTACCKAVSREEHKRLFMEFCKHDTDGSGCIDLKEFKSMCSALGAELTDAEVDQAMKELDKDGNGTCDFDEFLFFWTSTTSCGGYDSLTLQFLQARLQMGASAASSAEAADEAMRKFTSLDKVECNDTSNCEIKIVVAVHPSPSRQREDKMSATLTIRQPEVKEPEPEVTGGKTSFLKLRMSAESVDEAKRVEGLLSGLLKEVEEPLKNSHVLPGPLTVAQEDTSVVLVLDATAALPPIVGSIISSLEKLEVGVSLNMDCADLLKDPEKAIDAPSLLCGKLNLDICLTPKVKMLALQQFLPPIFFPLGHALGILFAGGQLNLHIALDEGRAHAALKKLSGGFMENLHMYTPANIQRWFKGVYPSLQDQQKNILKTLRSCINGLTGIDSINVEDIPCSIPGTVVKVAFDNLKPFGFLSYITQSMAEECPEETHKPIPQSERDRLKAEFDKHDKDGNGNMDLAEFQEMCLALGAKITEEEAKEAMKQLDTDGNGTCCFDEFLECWNARPELGGYSSMALELMKLRVASQSDFFGGAKSMMQGFFSGSSASEPEGFKSHVAISATAGLKQMETKMSLGIAVRNTVNEGKARLELRLKTTSAEAAEKVAQVLQKLIDEFKDTLAMILPGEITVMITEKPGVSLSLDLVSALETFQKNDPNFFMLANQAVECLNELELNCCLDFDFSQLLEKPGEPLFQSLSGVEFVGDLDLSPKSKDLILGPRQWLLELLAVTNVGIQIGFHPKELQMALSMLLRIPPQLLQMISLDWLKKQVTDVSAQPGFVDQMKPLLQAMKEITPCVDGLESLALRNMPIGQNNEEVLIKFDNFNPFPMLSYVLEPAYAHLPAADAPAAEETQSTEAAAPRMETPEEVPMEEKPDKEEIKAAVKAKAKAATKTKSKAKAKA